MDESSMNQMTRLNQMMQMQMRMQLYQQEVFALKAEGKDESGRVTVVYSGSLRFDSIRLAPDFVVPENKDELEKAILTACVDAISKVQTQARTKYQAIVEQYGAEHPARDAT